MRLTPPRRARRLIAGLVDALDVVAQDLAVALGASFAQSLTTLATARTCLQQKCL